MMPPQSDKLSILRAVLSQLAGRGAIPTDAYGQTALSGQSAPNLTNQFGQTALGGSNSPSRFEPGFDATMRDIRIKPSLLSQTDPYYSSLRAQVPSGDWYETGPRAGSRDAFGAYGRAALGENIDNVTSNWLSPTTKRDFRDGKETIVQADSKTRKGREVEDKTKYLTNKMESERVVAPSSNPELDGTSFDAALRGLGKSDKARPVQKSNAPAPKPSAQASTKSASPSTSPVKQQEKPSEPSKPAPVTQAEPSGEALSYFRKNKSSAGWDALGTAVSLVQRSLSPDKGGLKSRAEYDRLLRGSDNFKKLDGDEQQRVRQAFAQWMNEQTIFKGKA